MFYKFLQLKILCAKIINMGYYKPKNLTLTEKARLLTGGGYWTTYAVKDDGIPPIRFSDGPSGVRSQSGKGDNLGLNKSLPATCFPAHSAVACSWNRTLAESTGRCVGEEANEAGIDILLAPDLNVKRDPFNGRNFEYFSEDPYLNGKLGAAYARGVASAGVGACLKHFAANNREFGRMVCDSVVDERTLREIYLTPFEIAVKEAEPAAVMTAYNKLNGVYCSENSALIHGVLREEWGFEGITVTDWGGTCDRVAAVRAGEDLEMPACGFSAEEIEAAVNRGELSESAVDASATRILNYALREKTSPKENGGVAHRRFARRCAEECAVLLKNDGVLPLREGKIALIGEIAKFPIMQGGGSAEVNPESAESLYGCLKDKIIGFECGYYRNGKTRKKRALRLCNSADAVIFCAGHYGDAEGADRESLALPENQTGLLKKILSLGKRVVVALFCGSAVETDWDGGVNALLFAGLGGQSGASAVADILFGKVNPSGKLAETFPIKKEKRKSDPYSEIYEEGMRVGYRLGENVKYPFGFGLSYTSFKYSNLFIDDGGISFDLTNTGSVRGGEAAQMYVLFPDGAGAPFRQLKGFEKVFLNPGETKRVRIPFDGYTFRSYDAENHKWATVTGKYEIYVCSSYDDVKLHRSIEKYGGCEYVSSPAVSALKPSVYEARRDKNGRIVADGSTPFCELKNAKGAFGRAFAKTVLRAARNKRTVAGSLEYLPLRALAQYGKFGKKRFEGFLLMCNGKFFRGLGLFIKG